MSDVRRRAARALAASCARLLPPMRRAWAAAMMAEVEAIESGNAALGFAAGCVFASLRERALAMNIAVRSVRVAATAALLALAVGSALSAARVRTIDPNSGAVFALAAVCFAGAAIWSLLRGPIALVQAAGTMTAVYALACVLVRSDAAAGWLNADFYRALAIEGVAIWTALLAAGLFLLRGRAGAGDTPGR